MAPIHPHPPQRPPNSPPNVNPHQTPSSHPLSAPPITTIPSPPPMPSTPLPSPSQTNLLPPPTTQPSPTTQFQTTPPTTQIPATSPTTQLPIARHLPRDGDAPQPANDLPPPSPLIYPSFVFANIGGLLSPTGRIAKIPILTQDCNDDTPLFLAFTESHLNNTSKEKEHHIPNYSHIISNRKNRQKGGVIIYLHNHFTFKLLAEESDEMCSFLAIFINEIKLALFLAYRPPPDYTSGNLYHGPHLEHSFNNIVINKINNTIANLNTPVPDIILAGDFNFPKASWHEGTGIHPQGNSPESRMLSQLIDTCETHQLFQKITFGTRPTPTGGSNTLDLLFTNNHLLINHISHRLSSLSDHAIITCHTAHNLPLNINPATPDTPNPTTLSSFNLNRGCKENISEAANSLEWDTIFHGKDNSEKRRTLETHMLEILEQNCPKYAHKPGQTRNKIPRDRRILFRQRKRKLKLKNSMTTGNTRILTLTNEILDIENKLVVSFKNERLAEENKAINNIKTNPKHFYSFARKHQIIKGGIGPLKVNNKLITSPQEICENLSAQYSSVYSQPDPSNAITDPISFFTLDNPDIPSLLDIEFSEQMIEEEIASLKNHSAPGPDHFPVLLLKTYKKELSKPIYMMWRESLDNHDIDPLLLHAIVCPVQKPGSETYHAKSYRPISLTSHIIKISEEIVRKAIISHLINNNLLPIN